MANLSSTGAAASGKTYPHQYPYETPSLFGGVVQHVLISATTQINILRIVEETGSATVGDVVATLTGHPDPVAAILVMAELGLLVLDIRGVVDAHTVVRRATPEPDPQGPKAPSPISSVPMDAASAASVEAPVLPEGLDRLVVSPFTAALTLAQGGARREVLSLSDLRRPGVYGLISRDHLYIGTGSDVAQRVATGQQPIAGIDTLFVLTDTKNNLTADDAKVAERLLWNRCAASGERSLANGRPDGAAVDAQRFSEIDSLVAAACLALRHHGLLFVGGSTRGVVAGPRQEPGRLAPLRHLNQIPAGEVLELTFSDGLVALAAGIAGAWAVNTFIFETEFAVIWPNALAVVAGGVAATLAAGLIYAWRPLAARPARILRARE